MIELIEKRASNTKTYDLGNGKRQLLVSIGDIHFKDNYASNEQWKDIDLNWEGNKITKAPYELTLEGNKVTIRDKKSGEVSTIELLDIGGKGIPAKAWEKAKGLARAKGITTVENVALDTDLEVIAENSRVRFARVLRSDKAPKDTTFRVTGKIPFIVRASDDEGELPVEATLKDGILTETLKPDRAIKYPVRIDPTWQVGESTDDATRLLSPDYFSLVTSSDRAGADGVDNQAGTGMRFTNITIPQGSTIDQAYLTFRCAYALTGVTVRTRISAEDVDDAPTFAADKAAFDTRWAARTTARVDWDGIGAWTLDSDYDSPEIKTVIQEIVDRANWASGNDTVIFWEDFEDRSSHVSGARRLAYSYDGSSTYAPKLIITYSEVGWLGNIDEVRIYSRALTPLEIQHNYLATKWRYR